MTTNELIKQLLVADPSGNAHVRVGDGIPYFIHSLPGYYDGSYSYFDEEGNYCISREGIKVDINTMDSYDFIENHMGSYPNNKPFEEVLSKFRFYYGSSEEANERQRNEFIKKIREEYDEHITVDKRLYEEGLTKMEENAIKGWKWFQNKLVDTEGKQHFHYTWKIYDENGKEEGSCIHNTDSILYSGKWKKEDNNIKEGYYEWIYAN